MMRLRRVILWGIMSCLLSLSLTGCALFSGPPPATPVPQPVAQARNDEIVSAEAVIVPYRQTNLSFKIAGQVLEIMTAEGERVAAGQELARLDTRDLHQAVNQAAAGLKSAQAQLARIKAGARPEEIAAAEALVAIAQAGVKAAESAVRVAQGNLAAVQAALPSAQAAYQRLLDGADADELAAARATVELARVQRDQAQQAYDQIKDLPNAGMMPQALQLQQATINYETAQAQYRLVERGAGQAELTAAQALVFQAQSAIEIAEAQVAQAQAQVESAKAQAAQAQAQLDLVKAGARAEDIAVAEAAVAQAEVALDRAANSLDDAVLKAPFAGTVGAILAEEGELAVPQMPLVRLGDLTRLRVQTEDLSEVDIDQVRVGQEATVTVDALGGQTFRSQVARIAPVATELRGDKVYTVVLDLDTGQEAGLRWGMSAFVEIQVQ